MPCFESVSDLWYRFQGELFPELTAAVDRLSDWRRKLIVVLESAPPEDHLSPQFCKQFVVPIRIQTFTYGLCHGLAVSLSRVSTFRAIPTAVRGDGRTRFRAGLGGRRLHHRHRFLRT